MSTAAEKDLNLTYRLCDALGGFEHLSATLQKHARTLRLAQLTLHRWAEEMCNGTIQRGEFPDGGGGVMQGKPFNVREVVWPGGRHEVTFHPVPDREAGALRRVEQVCKEAGLSYWYQTDPRGCALYVAAEPLTAQNYSSKGIACI